MLFHNVNLGIDLIHIYNANYLSGDIRIEEEEITNAAWYNKDEILKLNLAFDIKKYLI